MIKLTEVISSVQTDTGKLIKMYFKYLTYGAVLTAFNFCSNQTVNINDLILPTIMIISLMYITTRNIFKV